MLHALHRGTLQSCAHSSARGFEELSMIHPARRDEDALQVRVDVAEDPLLRLE
ncbi:Hypothetical protein CAP_1410 [Chondromyces apiculatus DSM 436]|uniref:Uncharacterized protein n=1 Tax=Chondromyces apiculatus DSM 436 TaxID=1192034 RepID=A0A017SSZ5_9BACT|nr:Hypothetical protein CAP_1410 [Chondromyces apiculatus DSM 436]